MGEKFALWRKDFHHQPVGDGKICGIDIDTIDPFVIGHFGRHADHLNGLRLDFPRLQGVIGTDTELQVEQQFAAGSSATSTDGVGPSRKTFRRDAVMRKLNRWGNRFDGVPSVETSFLCMPSATRCAPSSSGHSIRPISESVALDGLSTITSYPAGIFECSPEIGLGEFLAAAATAKPATIKRRPLEGLLGDSWQLFSGFRRVA